MSPICPTTSVADDMAVDDEPSCKKKHYFYR